MSSFVFGRLLKVSFKADDRKSKNNCNSETSYALFVQTLTLNSLTMYLQINLDDLWRSADSGGWRPSSAPRSDWPRMSFLFFSMNIVLWFL